MECGYREQGEVEKLLIDHMQEQRRGKEMTLWEMQKLEITRDYVIPGLLARPYTTLLHGKYGTGKSSTILGLMKHICDGIPFQLMVHLFLLSRENVFISMQICQLVTSVLRRICTRLKILTTLFMCQISISTERWSLLKL